MSYADIVNLYASGAQVRHAFFFEFFFVSDTCRVWNGFRNIEVGGRLWNPVGPLATVDEIEDAVTDQQPTMELKVSGVDASLLAIALSEADEVRGQLVFIYDLFFDQNWQPVTPLENYAVAVMDTVKVTKTPKGDGTYEQIITIPSQYLLVNGASPPAGRLSTADQQIRYPGVVDNYFEYLPQLQNKQIRWPTF